MNTLKCCVIDDEPLAGNLLGRYIERTPGLFLNGIFTSAQEAVKTVLGGDVDVVYLDINMPQLNGLEFARLIPSTVSIVFTTAYDSYAIESFRVNAVHYLLKPISYEDFLDSVRRVNMLRNPSAPTPPKQRRHLIVKSEYKLVQINIDDILYIEGLKDYVKIVIEPDSSGIMTLMNIKSLELALPSPQFMRVHRSFIVNTNKIKVIERNRIVFGRTYIPVSESYKQTFADYVSENSVPLLRNREPEA